MSCSLNHLPLIDGWMDNDGWMVRWVNGWMNLVIGNRMDGWADRRINEWMMDGWVGWIDGSMDGWMNDNGWNW